MPSAFGSTRTSLASPTPSAGSCGRSACAPCRRGAAAAEPPACATCSPFRCRSQCRPQLGAHAKARLRARRRQERLAWVRVAITSLDYGYYCAGESRWPTCRPLCGAHRGAARGLVPCRAERLPLTRRARGGLARRPPMTTDRPRSWHSPCTSCRSTAAQASSRSRRWSPPRPAPPRPQHAAIVAGRPAGAFPDGLGHGLGGAEAPRRCSHVCVRPLGRDRALRHLRGRQCRSHGRHHGRREGALRGAEPPAPAPHRQHGASDRLAAADLGRRRRGTLRHPDERRRCAPRSCTSRARTRRRATASTAAPSAGASTRRLGARCPAGSSGSTGGQCGAPSASCRWFGSPRRTSCRRRVAS